MKHKKLKVVNHYTGNRWFCCEGIVDRKSKGLVSLDLSKFQESVLVPEQLHSSLPLLPIVCTKLGSTAVVFF